MRNRVKQTRVNINAIANMLTMEHEEKQTEIKSRKKTFADYINMIRKEFNCTWEEAKAIYHKERKEVKKEIFWQRVENEWKTLNQ